MAMAYGIKDTERAFAECFEPAVRATGFELRRLDTTPKAGLIDLRMRVDLRACKFVVADLTDENRGAYWESGFAEGLGRHVFYTCEATKFDRAKTHFDTEHMLTIRWSLNNLAAAADELKAAIRNTFPAEARQRD
jgi:nucleoside 2-deoxyribosyltransferase